MWRTRNVAHTFVASLSAGAQLAVPLPWRRVLEYVRVLARAELHMTSARASKRLGSDPFEERDSDLGY